MASMDDDSPSDRKRKKPTRKGPHDIIKKMAVVLREGVVFKNKETNEVFMPTTITMSNEIYPDPRLRQEISFTKSMTPEDIKGVIKNTFPILANAERFFCAKAVQKVKLDFCGERRIWSGEVLNREIKGHSVLYIYWEEENNDQQPSLTAQVEYMQISRNEENNDQQPSLTAQVENMQISRNGHSSDTCDSGIEFSEGPLPVNNRQDDDVQRYYPLEEEMNEIFNRYPLFENSPLDSPSGVTPAFHVAGSEVNNTAATQEHTLSHLRVEGEDAINSNAENLKSDSRVESTEVVNSEGEVNFPSRVEREDANSNAVPKSCDSRVESAEAVNRREEVNFPSRVEREDANSSAVPKSCDSRVESAEAVNSGEEVNFPSRVEREDANSSAVPKSCDSRVESAEAINSEEKVNLVEMIVPSSSPLKGGGQFLIVLKDVLPGDIRGGYANFGQHRVELKKVNNVNLTGIIPAAQKPELVKVQAYSQSERLLGEIDFQYIDLTDRVAYDAVQHGVKGVTKLFSLMGKHSVDMWNQSASVKQNTVLSGQATDAPKDGCEFRLKDGNKDLMQVFKDRIRCFLEENCGQCPTNTDKWIQFSRVLCEIYEKFAGSENFKGNQQTCPQEREELYFADAENSSCVSSEDDSASLSGPDNWSETPDGCSHQALCSEESASHTLLASQDDTPVLCLDVSALNVENEESKDKDDELFEALSTENNSPKHSDSSISVTSNQQSPTHSGPIIQEAAQSPLSNTWLNDTGDNTLNKASPQCSDEDIHSGQEWGESGRDDYGQFDKGERRLCQGRLCSSNVQTEKDFAVKVCHHEDCQETNYGNPLLLCLRCDEVHHLGAGSNHARFNVPERPSTNIIRTPSSHSAGSDSGNEEDVESEQKVEKKNRGYSSGKRMFKINAVAKKKPRRHNTEDPGREFFSIKFFDNKSGEFHVEVVPALKGKSLRESIEPLFEAQEFSFSTHSVFLDSSNTPLPLAFDTFPLGGNTLHVRANEDFKGDERVINIMRDSYAEEKNNSDETPTRPKSSSFLTRSGSFTTKGKEKGNTRRLDDDRERENSRDDKLLQQFNKNTQKGKKNMESLFGKEFGGTMPPTLSSPVLPGGVHISGAGTMPRPKSASRLTGLFNPPKPSIKGTLKDSLDRYSLYGLEDSADYDSGLKNEIEEQIKLESSWTEVVDERRIGSMTKKEKDQQEAMWELLSTEAVYISKLYIIKKLFLQCLRNLQSEGFLVEIEASKLFNNVEQIYEVNLAFWTEHLSKVVEYARKTKDLLNPLDMEAGFNMFEAQFDPYIKYCMEESKCLKYYKEKLVENEDFKTYITWCEDHRFCTDRLKLTDLLVWPMQRVTKYHLLLKAIGNKTTEEDTKDVLNRMRVKVETFVSKVNAAMKERHELEKLKATAVKIHNNYSVVEAVNEEMEKILQDYSSYDLTRPMPGLTDDQHRSVIHEGNLRLLEKQGKMDVYVFLFTDLLLITKAKKADKFKVIKPPLQVDKLVTARDQGGTFLLIYVNEYNIAVQAFALQGTASDQAQWMDAIKKAQKLFMVAKLGQGSSNVHHMQNPNDNDLVSPSGLVTPSGLSPALPRPQRRRSSGSSIISVESDSEDELGMNFSTLNSRARSDSALTTGSSTHSSEVRGKEVATKSTKYTDGAALQRQEEILSVEDEQLLEGAMAKSRSESLGKISRSSSAPPKERPRVVDSSSLSRSSSAPQGPTSVRVASLREAIIMKRRTTEEQDGSVTSSSASLNDSAGDSEVQSPLANAAVDFSLVPPPNYQQTNEVRSEPQSPNQEDSGGESPRTPAEENNIQPPSSLEKGVSSSMSDNDYESSEYAGEQEEDSVEEPLESEGDLSPSKDCRMDLSVPQVGQMQEFQALQNLSDSMEATFKSNGPSKQPPLIKSQLIAQDKIQSVITTTEQPRKRISLPRRSSPVISRKTRPVNIGRHRDRDSHDVNGIIQKIRDASFASATEATISNQERGHKVGKLTKRSSESTRLPVKPDKAHYPTSVDLEESQAKAEKKKEHCNSLSRTRKKSMSLSDLLNIGKDLTSNRDKNKDKEVDKDKSHPKTLEPTSPLTDEDAISPTSVDELRYKREEKRSRFSRLRRKSSRGVGELKDGIASGPDIDPKRASRHFFKESLMLESSEYV